MSTLSITPVIHPPADAPDAAAVAAGLLQALADGDPTAWRMTTRRYAALVGATARRYSLTPQEAEDAGQRVWMLLFQHASQIRDPRCLPGWISTTARRECLAIVRRRHLEYPVGDQYDAPADGPEPDEQVAAKDSVRALLAAIEQLPDRQRELMHMLATTAASYAEVSRRLGMPIGSIGPVRARALVQLRLAIGAPQRREERAGSPGPTVVSRSA